MIEITTHNLIWCAIGFCLGLLIGRPMGWLAKSKDAISGDSE